MAKAACVAFFFLQSKWPFTSIGEIVAKQNTHLKPTTKHGKKTFLRILTLFFRHIPTNLPKFVN